MKTDYEKIKMKVKWALEGIWLDNKELAQFEHVENKAEYFKNKYSNMDEAITEAYFWGRQHGRATLAKAILRSIGEPLEEADGG